MHLYPDTAETKLGFDVLRERLVGYALSPVGAERLAAMQPCASVAEAQAEMGRVAELLEALRFDEAVPFDAFPDVRATLRRVAPEGGYANVEDLADLRRVLRVASRARAYFEARRARYPSLHAVAARLAPADALERRLDATLDADGRLRDDATPELARLRRQIVQTQSRLRARLMDALRDAIGQGFATEEQPTIRGGRMVIPVRAEARRKVEGFVHDTSATGQTVYIEPAAVLDLNNEVRELEGEERREVERILRLVSAEVRAALPDLEPSFRALVRLDVLHAKARLARTLDAHAPRVAADGVVRLRQARHPLLVLRFKDEGRAVVPLTLTLGEAFRTLVITGPNAGGKSVALKAVGLFALMVSYGLPIPAAEGSSVSFFEKLVVDIGDEQRIEEDLSTFTSHVRNLRHLLAHADAQTLVLLDEAGTGTDPAEGGAIAQAVLEHLTAAGARTVATTHIGALKGFAHEHPDAENGAMVFDQASLSPAYQLQVGVPGSSYAFEIAAREGLDAGIVARARSLVGERQTAVEDLILRLEARSRAVEAEKAALAEARAAAEQAEARFRQRDEQIRTQRNALKQQALAQAEEIVRGANARIEKAIRDIREAEASRAVTQAARAEVEAIAQQVQKQQKKVRPRPSRRAPDAPREAIAVGDQVMLEGGTATAEVLEIRGREAVIAQGSIRLRAPLESLRRVGGPQPQRVTVKATEGTGGAGLSALSARTRVDLRGQRVEDALMEVDRLLDEAAAAGLERVEILHGKGTGALRLAIRDHLKARPEVTQFEDAPWEQGGPGVTYVSLT